MQKFKNNQKEWMLYDLHPGFVEATVKILVSKRIGQTVILHNIPENWKSLGGDSYKNAARFWYSVPLPTEHWKILKSLGEIKIQKMIDFTAKPEVVSSEIMRALNL